LFYTLKGAITIKRSNFIVLEVSQIGYQIFLLPKNLKTIKKDTEQKFFIYHHFRENEQTLYGFVSLEQRKIFEALNSVSGIGPKKALEILNRADWQIIYQASANQNPEILEQAGLTSIMAEKIIAGLKRKIKDLDIAKKNISGMNELKNNLEVIEALQGLGYQEQEIKKALEKIDLNLKVEDKIKECLKGLAK